MLPTRHVVRDLAMALPEINTILTEKDAWCFVAIQLQ
jgi:hypothetical protein